MTRSFLTSIPALLFFSTVTLTAQASYDADRGYYAQNGGGYYYAPGGNPPPDMSQGNYAPPTAPPPPGTPPEDYYVGEGVGPYFRAGVGPSFFQRTHLTHFGVRANDKVFFNTGLA